MKRATIRDINGALGTLCDLLPDQHLELEHWGAKVRIIRPDHSRPFGSDWMTRTQAYARIWFAVDALRLQKEGQDASC